MEPAQAQPRNYFPLLSLANELVLLVIEQISSREDLINLAVTSSQLRDLVEPRLWRSLLVFKGSEATRIASACRRRPELLSMVQELAIRYTEENEDGIEHLDEFLVRMGNLKELEIETPCPNNHGNGRRGVSGFPHFSRIRYTKLFLAAVGYPYYTWSPLSMLQSVTLHGHHVPRGRPFSLGHAASIFLHPTLRQLTISCADIECPLEIPESKVKSTNLQSLTLIECNVYLAGLEKAVSLPKALKELSVRERQYTWPDCEPDPDRPRTLGPEFLTILQMQASSLERLAHDAGDIYTRQSPIRTSPPPTAAEASQLSNFTSLKYLELGHGAGYLAQCLRQGGFPPNLETLRITDATYKHNTLYRQTTYLQNFKILSTGGHQLAICSTALPLHLELVYQTGSGLKEDHVQRWWHNHDDPICQQNRLELYNIALVLKARGGSLKVFMETFPEGRNFIPPYLYGEDRPVEKCIYDSEHPFLFLDADHVRFVRVERWDGDERYFDIERDTDGIPEALWAVCTACAEKGEKCWNEGYGTMCSECLYGDARSECTYPPMASPWMVRDVGAAASGR